MRARRQLVHQTMGLGDWVKAAHNMIVAQANDTYSDVIAEMWRAEVPVYITTTGGLCLAMQADLPGGGYLLLTDEEDVLSADRDESQGWCAGLYSDGDLVVQFTADRKTPAEAVRVVMACIQALNRAR